MSSANSPFDLVIESRPQIKVSPDEAGNVQITVTSIDEPRMEVEQERVFIPAECVAKIAAALQAIAVANQAGM